MLICIFAPGSRGDVEPYVALGKGLLQAGHSVRLVTHEDFRALVEAQGLEFWPFKGKVQDIVQGAQMRQRLGSGSFVAVISEMAKEAQRGAVHMAEVGLAACRGSDLVLAGLGGLFVGLALAEKLDLPFVQAHYIPLTPTRAYPSFFFPRPPSWFGASLNRFSYQIVRQILWQGFRSADTLARKEVLGLPAAPFWGPFGSERLSRYPLLYGFSPAVIPKAPDWGPNTYVTGYWFLESPSAWEPPAALADFLEAGPPPVYVGFGSMSSGSPEETADLVLESLAQAGQRGILLSGWGGLRKAEVPESVLMVDSVPFSWLFPRMAAVVHHGGAGTTSAGLRAGVPSVVVPFFGDQPFWGQRVADLGVGPQPLRRRNLTADKLAAALGIAVTDQEMRQRAARLGATIRAEDGITHAVTLIGELA